MNIPYENKLHRMNDRQEMQELLDCNRPFHTLNSLYANELIHHYVRFELQPDYKEKQ